MELSKKMEQIAGAARNNGFNPVIGDIYLMQDFWKSWWRGNVNNFHHYTERVNGRTKKRRRRTINAYKMLCEEWESLLWGEDVQLKVTNNERANERLQKVLKLNNDYLEMGNLIEKTFALGNGMTVVYKAKGKTNIDYITGEHFIPISFENNTMTGVLTMNESVIVEGDVKKYITHLTYHWLDETGYHIKHEVYASEKDDDMGAYRLENITYVFSEEEANQMLKEIPVNDKKTSLVHMIDIETGTKFFQPIRPNIANNYDESSMGVGVGANMIDLFESADIKFDASSNEILNNKTRIVVNSQFFKRAPITDEKTGDTQWIQYLDENDTVIMGLPFDDEDGDMVKHFQGEFRMEDIKTGLTTDVSLIGWRGGLGKKYFSFNDGEIYVNEKNVITSNSALFKNKRKHENLLEVALIEKAKAILYLENDMGEISVNLNELEYEVTFDDSIINDDESKLSTMKEDAKDGVIPYWRYIMLRYKLTEEEAKKWAKEADKENGRDIDQLGSAVERGIISIKDAQSKLYPELNENELTVKYIETKLEQGMPLKPHEVEEYEIITNKELIMPRFNQNTPKNEEVE